jgi:nicotinamide mononucleotide adenylyltransferase
LASLITGRHSVIATIFHFPQTMSESLPQAPNMTHAETASEPSSDERTYSFPHNRLKRVMSDSAKVPLCLVACGSFSPITYLHLRMFEMAADYAKFNTDFEVVGGYLSPVSDAYKKAGLASADHRSAPLFQIL